MHYAAKLVTSCALFDLQQYESVPNKPCLLLVALKCKSGA